ncbi:magnesium chelatase [Candidatus Poriferisocius sp.]|uniref:magnesium chelatase n=1 Tax=Candidatus Poriferisocius sp. TaxID=3101276 RepID=UPI003B5A6A1C
MSQPATLGELKAAGWQSVPVKEEIRRNAIARIRAGEDLFPGIWGYEETVIPQLETALLASHDVIFLGERGQAKTRMIRLVLDLLDEWLPVVAGSEVNDDPYHPVSKHAQELIAAEGDHTPLAWVHRSHRYGEKLATPDTSIADLIGEVDPIKVAEGRYLSDELTIHYGLVPRTNRGVFAINELPDLAERIQVGLLNVLEERDVQIRGHKIRLPLDILLFASANPEDYTNRGRIITPLKDRFGAQIRTHYPSDVDVELDITEQEATLPEADVPVIMPDFMGEVLVYLSQLARQSPHVNQRSGVSVRLTVSNYETLAAAAIRRCLRSGEAAAVPRVTDLDALAPSTMGKIEIETIDDDRDAEIVGNLRKEAVRQAFKDAVDLEVQQQVIEAFEDGRVVNAGDDISSADYAELVGEIPAFAGALAALGYESGDLEHPGLVASGIEFVLEGLHLSKRLNKESLSGAAVYRGRT